MRLSGMNFHGVASARFERDQNNGTRWTSIILTGCDCKVQKITLFGADSHNPDCDVKLPADASAASLAAIIRADAETLPAEWAEAHSGMIRAANLVEGIE